MSTSPVSRYKDTIVHSDNGDFLYGPWRAPEEFQTVGLSWKRHMVKQSEVGFLDILAVKYFGDGQDELWWVIAQANGIVDTETDMYPGQVLNIPPRALVDQFIARSGNVK